MHHPLSVLLGKEKQSSRQEASKELRAQHLYITQNACTGKATSQGEKTDDIKE